MGGFQVGQALMAKWNLHQSNGSIQMGIDTPKVYRGNPNTYHNCGWRWTDTDGGRQIQELTDRIEGRMVKFI